MLWDTWRNGSWRYDESASIWSLSIEWDRDSQEKKEEAFTLAFSIPSWTVVFETIQTSWVATAAIANFPS